ncbi:metal-sulfur cluster assembly factor [Paludibacterium yongneupense]|uniref:metal-sulfur cluster assembly factor n=1 Tax=Paludibacterium yongneupense TaxID=400061 RepID=UPI00040C3635|nr:metal-sulfur cluster assembly factor [Paludibacterium yongneupense]
MPATIPATEADILAALETVLDPEVGINIVDLGLIYRVALGDEGVLVRMTMTSPSCPMSETVLADVRDALAAALPSSVTARVELVFDPPWDASRMSARARALLGV